MTLIVCLIVVVVTFVCISPPVNCSYTESTTQVNSSSQLERVLKFFADDDQMKETEIVLDQAKSYELLWQNFIPFIGKDIVIRSSSSQKRITLECNGKHSISSGGLAFVNSTVKLTNLHFISCGANLSELPYTIVDMLLKVESSFPANKATLLFISSKVTITDVYIEGSKGYAISAINLLTASIFQHMKIYESIKVELNYIKQVRRGGAMLLFFRDDPQTVQTHENITVSMKNVVFKQNINVFAKGYSNRTKCILSVRHIKNLTHYAAGLTIRYTQETYFVNVTIDNGHFNNNVGQICGAVLIINYDNVSATTVIQNSIFKSNGIKKCYGKDLLLLHQGGAFPHLRQYGYPLVVENSIFYRGLTLTKSVSRGNAITIGIYPSNVPMLFYFKNLKFTHNYGTAEFDGTCMLFKQLFKLSKNSKSLKDIIVTMANIHAMENINHYIHAVKSLFHYKQVNNVTFTGYGRFENNFGSVIHAEESNLYLTGNMTFINNTANKGAAIYIHGNVQLHFKKGLQALFINNNAYYSGGAIYAKCATSFSRSQCAIQYTKSTNDNTKFIFKNNIANVAGNSIYAEPISYCSNEIYYKKHWLKKYLKYFNLSKEYDAKNDRLQLSTRPNWLIAKVWNKDNRPLPRYKTLQKFPGEEFLLHVSAYDLNHRKVFSHLSLEIFLVKHHEANRKYAWLHRHQTERGSILLEQKYPTNIFVTVHTSSSNYTRTKLVLSIPGGLVNIYYINLKPCPVGFRIDSQHGACRCCNLFKQHRVWCDIDRRTINRKDLSTWIGLDQNFEALSPYCPYLYCNSNPQYGWLRSTNHGFLLSNATGLNGIPICMNHRTGVLCGHCDTSNNYSLVFGSSECKQCSNLWLITIIGYSIIGPLLVYILYVLRLTITVGTFNGAIFYVQAANAGLIEYMTTPYTETILNGINHVYRSIFLFLNLNLGIPLCFYNGMDQLWKTGLGLVFPVYLLLIVVCVIIISQYSTWVSNRTAHLSVQVLVTVVHLSFSKLLETLIEVFTAATVYTADPDNSSHLVWYWDASVEYLGSSHLLLTAITTTIVSLLLIPYIGLLAYGRRIMKYSKRANLYLRPVIEAAYAPYKEGKQHWFVLHLILLIVVYILYVLFRTGTKTILNISMTAILASFTVMKAFYRPYKNNAITVVDCWLMINITIVYTTLWSPTQSTATLVFNTTLVSLGLLTIGGILLYHILQVTKYKNIIINNLMKGKKYLPLVRRRHHQYSSNAAGQPIGQQGYKGSHRIGHEYRQLTGSSCQHVYREPLITEIYCDSTASISSNDSD